ncbi:IS1380 family transposase [bacterium]|nr:IS1380 family transposase [bacterium]
MDFSNIEPFAFKSRKSVLQKIKIELSKEKLTAAAGLGTLIEIFDQSGLAEHFKDCLPERVSHRSQGSYKLALNMICGFIHGFDCLDDHDDFQGDEGIKALFGEGTPHSRTLGDFLRNFEDEHLAKLNQFLSTMSWSMLASLEQNLPEEHKPKKVCLDIDSTDHPQSGNEMEGLAWNYKDHWCLDSQVVFDQKGFSHGFDLRAGNTKSGVGAEWLLLQALKDGKKQRERRFEGKTFVRGDSAYCYQDVIKTLTSQGVLFTLTAHDGTTDWKDQFSKEGLVWTPWVYSEEEIKKAELKQKDLPQVELARFYWTPKWSKKDEAKLVFPIVVKRTLNRSKFEEIRRKTGQLALIHDDGYLKEDPYDYYAVVCNFPLDLSTERAIADTESEEKQKIKRYSLQEVMEHHQKRGNSENFIREEKYGYDLKHFPCLKLNANRAYGLLAMVAHNLLRYVAIMMKPEKPHFSKKLRKRFVFHAGKIVMRSRQVFLRISKHGYEEVRKLREAWGMKPETVPQQFSTA